MKIVGKALRTYKSALPLIGIFSWGVTNGRQKIDRCAGQVVPYAAEKASGNGAPLNMDHTHFILVDNGKEGGAAWGGEIKVIGSSFSFEPLRGARLAPHPGARLLTTSHHCMNFRFDRRSSGTRVTA